MKSMSHILTTIQIFCWFLIKITNGSIITALNGFTGRIILPTEPDYAEMKLGMNAACVAEPAVIVLPTDEYDVSRALLAAQSLSMEISVRGGGHSYTCNSFKNNSLHIDMREMDSIQLIQDSDSPTGLAALLGAGATWGSVLRILPPTTYSYPHGQCRSVGVAGYLLGGGVNWLGTYNKLGYGAESVLSMKAVLADGSIAVITPQSTKIIWPTASEVIHTSSNNLFFALRGAGSSYAVVTEFLYVVHQIPEALPGILLAWADNIDDLNAIQRAGQDSSDYSVTISQEFTHTFWQNPLTRDVYKVLFPPIMAALRKIGKIRDGVDSYPVFLTVTDISSTAGRYTDVVKAAEFVKSKGVRMVIQNSFFQIIFNILGTLLYNANIEEQEQWAPGQYSLATFNFGSLSSHSAFQDIFFNDPYFGTHRQNFLNSVDNGCDYCFWMVLYRNRQALGDIPISTETTDHLPKSLDTNLVCMFSDPASQCPNIVSEIKTEVESFIISQEPGYSKYYNFPSCSSVSGDWAERYWGDNLPALLNIKDEWDPENVFNHCQSVGSSDLSGQACCPFSEVVDTQTTTTASSQLTSDCKTVLGAPCRFPFTYKGVIHTSCTRVDSTSPWCATGDNPGVDWGVCSEVCPSEEECATVSGAKPGLKCKFPFRYKGTMYYGCVTAGFDLPWCSTATDFFGNHITGNWGDCDKNTCPIKSS